jgi:1-acyl-sn-glycerol-3-phosphate acyltransferase
MKMSSLTFSPLALIHLLLIRPVVRLVFGISIEGAENVRELKQYILVANHNSHLDIPLLFSILPLSHVPRTHPVAALEYFEKSKIFFWVVDHLFRPIWVVRGEAGQDTLAGIQRLIEEGHNIIIFPEGTRGSPGEICRFKSGVGRLAEEHPEIPVLPVFLCGPERALPKTYNLPLPLCSEVTVGPPQVFSGDRRDFTLALEGLIRELSRSAAAIRHKRRGRRKSAFTVAVLGIDGSGKSTLSREIAQRLAADVPVCLVTDQLEFYSKGAKKQMQPLPSERLRCAVGGYAKRARSLKHYKVPKLTELLLRDHVMSGAKRWYSPEFLILDGCPLLNLVAWANIYKPEHFSAVACRSALLLLSGRGEALDRGDPVRAHFPELAALRRTGLARLTMPDAVVMLDVDPALSLERIGKRGEKQQAHETAEKLARLREGYLQVCRVVETDFGIPSRIMDGSGTIDSVAGAAIRFVDESRNGGTDRE